MFNSRICTAYETILKAREFPLYSCAVELIFSMRVNAGQKENTRVWASRGRCTFIYRAALFFIFFKLLYIVPLGVTSAALTI